MNRIKKIRMLTKTDVTLAILSRDKVADAAAIKLRAATLSCKQTRLLHHFSRLTILLHKHGSKVMKLFHI